MVNRYEKLFHLRKDREGRLIPLIPVIDDEGKIYSWFDTGAEIIDNLKPVNIVEGLYFAKEMKGDKDVYFRFIDFTYQRAVNKDVFNTFHAMVDDINILSTCISKMELYFGLRKTGRLTLSETYWLVWSEIEHVFTVCRSYFDLLQYLIKMTWDKIELLNTELVKQELPGKFSELLPKRGKLKDLYGLTPRLVGFYDSYFDFFLKLKNWRDAVIHYGKKRVMIFVTEKGFGVFINSEPFASFSSIWRPDTFLPNNIAPIRPIISHVIGTTLLAADELIDSLSQEITFPEDIAPGYSVFLRGPYVNKLLELEESMTNKVWDSDWVE
jgi:hypothetical protein